jgi:hypothetical protein
MLMTQWKTESTFNRERTWLDLKMHVYFTNKIRTAKRVVEIRAQAGEQQLYAQWATQFNRCLRRGQNYSSK